MRKAIIRENVYYDSVTLMLISSRVTGMPGVENAAVMMGTDQNKDLMLDSGLITPEEKDRVTANDMVIGILADTEETVGKVLEAIEEEFKRKNTTKATGEARVRNQDAALRMQPDSNLAIVSIPGRYCRREVMKALDNNLNVMLFSDNVSIEDEIALKDRALEKGLFMMGPDCGSVIMNGVGLGFANAVKRGGVGMVAAAGTGLQETTVIIDRNGAGISQAIGTGGRDLKAKVGGRTMLFAIEALKNDPETEVIVIVSKPADPEVAEKIINALRSTDKPKVMCILGGEPPENREQGFYYVETLEDAGIVAADLCKGNEPKTTYFSQDRDTIRAIVQEQAGKLKPEQTFLRGLYGGGTLTYESLLIVRDILGDAYSNTPLKKELQLADVKVSQKHTVLDMGDDFFTNGRPHPMIDTRLRTERILEEAALPEVAVILLDCVIGYGAHPDPAADLARVIAEARAIAARGGRHIVFVGSVCGTEADPQVRSEQERKLREAGVIIMDSNAQAARMAAIITERGQSLDKLSWEVN